jgi:hypothetical protein
MPIPPVRIVEDGIVTVTDAFILSFFVNETHEALVRRVEHVLALYVDFVGFNAVPYRLDDEGEVVGIEAKNLRELVYEVFQDPDIDPSVIRLVGAVDNQTGYGFKYVGDQLPDPAAPDLRNLVTLWLPTKLCTEVGWDFVQDFSRRVAAMLPNSYGYASPCLAYGDIMQAIPVAKRYPGFDIASGIACRVDIDDKAIGVYWLNFFGEGLLNRLGGRDHLTAVLPAPMTVNDVGQGGIVVRLGREPEVGDRNRRIDLPLHRHLAQVIDGELHVPQSVYFPDENGIRDPEAMAAWHRRFLRSE